MCNKDPAFRTEPEDASDERMLDEMRERLVREEEVPLGMIARLEAGVRRATRERQRRAWEVRAVIASVVFAVIGVAHPAAFSLSFALITAALATLYSLAVGIDDSDTVG